MSPSPSALPSMRAKATATLAPPEQQPIRASCDQCRKRKLRCPGAQSPANPVCGRCTGRGEQCTFSARKRMGRPRTVNPFPTPSLPPSPCSSNTPKTPKIDSASLTPTFGFIGLATPRPEHDDLLGDVHGSAPDWAPKQLETSALAAYMAQPLCTPPNCWTSLDYSFPWFNDSGDEAPASSISNGSASASPRGMDLAADHYPYVPGSYVPVSTAERGWGTSMMAVPQHTDVGCALQGTARTSTPALQQFQQVTAPGLDSFQQQPQLPLPSESRDSCLCHPAQAIERLREVHRALARCSNGSLDYQELPSGSCRFETALEALQTSGSLCEASLSCSVCTGDLSTSVTVFTIASLATQLLQVLVPALDSAQSHDTHVPHLGLEIQIGAFRPSACTMTYMALAAIGCEVSNLVRQSRSLVRCFAGLACARGEEPPTLRGAAGVEQLLNCLEQQITNIDRRLARFRA